MDLILTSNYPSRPENVDYAGTQGGRTLFRLRGIAAIVVSLFIALIGVAVAVGVF